MKNRTIALLISLLPLVSACSEGRNLFPADAVELLGEIVAKTQSPDFLMPATFGLTIKGPIGQKEVAYDGGTHRLYVKEEREGKESHYLLYAEEGFLRECRLVGGEYLVIPYPVDVAEERFRDYAAPYVVPCLELLRMVPEGALYVLENLGEEGNEDLSYEVLSSGQGSAEISYVKEEGGHHMTLKASIEKNYLRSLDLTSMEESWSYDFSYALPSFPDFPLKEQGEWEETPEASVDIEGQEGDGRYETGVLRDRRLIENATLWEGEGRYMEIRHGLSLNEKPMLLTFLALGNREEGQAFALSNQNEDGLYGKMESLQGYDQEETRAFYQEAKEEALSGAKALMEEKDAEIVTHGETTLIKGADGHAIVHGGRLIHCQRQNGEEISYFDYSYPMIAKAEEA